MTDADGEIFQHLSPQAEIALGLRDEFSWGELAVDAALGTVTSGASTVKNAGRIAEVGIRAANKADDVADASRLANKADDAADIAQAGAKRTDDALEPSVVDLKLKHKEGWTPEQRAAGESKCAALCELDAVVTKPERGSQSASSMFKKAGNDVPQGADVDHIQDL